MAFSSRTELLLGRAVMQSLGAKRIILFGTGGVGSWCAESLIRTGAEHLTIVDGDVVAQSNINRQVMALQSTVGKPKAEAMKARLKDINPAAEITAVNMFYTAATVNQFRLGEYDYVVDCIDSLADKALLLVNATASGAQVFSSMGAARKLDPTAIRVAELWKVRGCPLGAALRKRLVRSGQTLAKPVTCVYSEEKINNEYDISDCETPLEGKQINGSIVHVTAVFGFTLAGLIVQDIINNTKRED
ncbi:MAG: tRNA threonylcarbamoyladenosine dehydratase [Prevotella sp.]|nr:tRNA threonylcarbamoyladenosine dehydratase [Prevotella sp.]